jgi:hypothetical protein
MVSKTLTRAFYIILIVLTSQATQAQEENNEESHHSMLGEKSFLVGLGAPYSLELKTAGINARFYYGIGEAFCFGPEFSYFKQDEIEIFDVDFVAHYILNTPVVGLYPVAGINYTKESEEGHADKKEYGFLWGAGIHRIFKNIVVFAEYTRVESKLNDQFITAGLMYHIKFKN